MALTGLLLALTLLTGDPNVLVLRSGHRIPVEGAVQVQDGMVLFRHPSGVLYSIPLSEVDIEATENAGPGEILIPGPHQKTPSASQGLPVKKLRVSAAEKERLLRELQKSRGTRVPARPGPPSPTVAEEEVEVRERSGPDEVWWRSESKRLEENAQRRREEVEMLKERIQRLEDEIRFFISQGMPGDQYGGNMMQLQDARAMLEEAQLGLNAAERALDDFRETARREGILPGWLR